MPSSLPVGDPPTADGSLPDSALSGLGRRPFGVYVHVPFCTVRCGYCDFNTYTADELGPPDGPAGASRATYAAAAVEEVRRARRALGDVDLPASTVFFGGGTPTLLDPDDLGAVLAAVRDEFGLVADAEVTTEANPDSVGPHELDRLRAAGVNRISFGMQSAVPHVLAVLDRTHDPDRVPERGRLGTRRRVRPGQPRPDLRHARGVAVATGRGRWRPPCPARRTTSRRTP